jgi:formylmethanofuran dehydrogenase subunit B
LFVPNGRSDRTCVVVDVRKTETANAADLFLRINPGSDFEAIWILRALAAGIEVDAEQSLRETGLPLSAWQDLMARMKAAKFGVLFYGLGVTMSRGRHMNAEAILALTRDMNQYTRFVSKSNRSHSNLAGADNVLTWRTGYPFGVNLARGFPRFNPNEYTATEVLARKEVDAALIVASDPLTELPDPACERLASIPYMAVDFRDTATMRGATVAFRTARYGIHTPGTVYRMDDVPIPLRPALSSPLPGDLEILRRIEKRVKELNVAAKD